MGKFDGLLLVSDFDNTLVYTEEVFRRGGTVPPLSPENRRQIQYWMDNGGAFAVVTGRTWQLIRPFLGGIPTNAPCGVGNGAALVDPASGRRLYERFLPAGAADHMDQVLAAFPRLSCEIFRADDRCDAINPCAFSYRHAQSAGYTFRVVESLRETPPPVVKILFEADDHEPLARLAAFVRSRSWFDQYELIFSSDFLLEMVARGANKGVLVRRVAEMTGVGMDRVYCVGDQENDLAMLRIAREGFVPANAAPQVLEAGFTRVCHCREGAVAQVVDLLDRRY